MLHLTREEKERLLNEKGKRERERERARERKEKRKKRKEKEKLLLKTFKDLTLHRSSMQRGHNRGKRV